MAHIKVMEAVAVFRNNIMKILAGLFCILSLTACGAACLEKSEVQKLAVNYEKINNVEYVLISGIPFHSALTPTQYVVADKGDFINVKLEMELCRNNLGLPLDIRVAIRDKTKYITFGENNDVIWERK